MLGEAHFPASQAGKKAAHLHRLAQAGFRVPMGFSLTEDAFSRSSDRTYWRNSLEFSIAAIGGYPVAVRSSGVLEDLEGASFAGQYTTILEVESLEDLLIAIRKCRDAASQENVIAYARARGIRGPIPAPSLLIQKMVNADRAGVAFAIHPVTGKEEHSYIELCRGLGEKLVSGTANPTRLTLSLVDDGQIIESELGEDSATLSNEEARELALETLKISAHFGHPQDVEWAIDDKGRLAILQARPITRVQWRSDTEEMTNADLKDGGVSARVCTPMMFSLYQRSFQESMQRYFENVRFLKKGDRQNWMHSYYGRVYWNAGATKRGLYKIPGFEESAFDRDLGIQKDYGPQGPVKISSTSPQVLLRAIPVAIGIEAEFSKNLKMTESFGIGSLAADSVLRSRLRGAANLEDSEWFELFEEIIDRHYSYTEQSYFSTIYNNSNAQTLFKELLSKIDQKTNGSTRLVHLLSGLTDVSHLEMQRGILTLFLCAREQGLNSTEFANAVTQFLNQNDFHSDAELEITTPRWGEDASRVHQMIADMIASGVTPTDPETSSARQRQEFKDEVESVHSRISSAANISRFSRWQFRRSFDSQLKRVRTFLSRREAMRELSTRAYYLVRLALIESARRLVARGELKNINEIFQLSWSESLDAQMGTLSGAELRSLIEKRTLFYDAYRNFQAPNEFGSGVSQISAASLVSEENGSRVLRGVGCSPGVFEGPVKVIEKVEDMRQINEGDILVTKFTDPGWTPVLGLVRGIITEVGGMLSHAAVISREYGIPAVLNLPGAMKELERANRVRIDGNTGKITILELRSSDDENVELGAG